MSGAAAWQRVANARAILSPDRIIDTGPEHGRDRLVVRNEVNGTNVRVGAALWQLVQRFDGRATIGEHLERENEARRLQSRAPIRAPAALDAVARGIGSLERAGLVDCRHPCGWHERSAQAQKLAARKRRARWSNPLCLRVPLHDPDRWLDRWQPMLERVRLRALAVALVLLLGSALCVAIASGPRLLEDLGLLAETPRRWWWLLLVWPVLKAAHELAHALVTRRFGGRVHEVGIALLVLMPVPYVDASDAWLFPARRERMLVSAAGMLAEGALAAFALLVWSVVEPGLIRDAALATVITGAVTTVLFNANPLLRFDGYFLLQDALDMPNLAARSAAWWRSLARRRLFGIIDSALVPRVRDRRWLAGYGLASLFYRYVVMVTIAWWLLETVPLLGVPLAGYALWPLLVQPVVRMVRWLMNAEELAGRRLAASAPPAVLAVTLVVGLVILPVGASSRVTGVVRAADSTMLSAPETAELRDLAQVRDVRTGDIIATLYAPGLMDEAARLQARLGMLDAAIGAAFSQDPMERRLLRGERAALADRADEMDARIAALDVRASASGRFVPASADLLPGQHVERGTLLGHLVGEAALSVHAVLQEHQFAQATRGLGRASVRLAEAPLQVHTVQNIQQSPSAGHRLPSVALAGNDAGGIAVAGRTDRMHTVRPVFDVEVALPPQVRVAGLGGRAYITFHHPAEPLARRWWRGLRRLFLERLAI